MSRAVLLPFQQNQKNKISFVQQIAELASNPKNIPTLQAAGVMHELRPLLTDVNPSGTLFFIRSDIPSVL